MRGPRIQGLRISIFLMVWNFAACSFNVTPDQSYYKASVENPSDLFVAVVPLANGSNYIEAPEVVQSAFVDELKWRGWNVMDPSESNEQLRENLGINYGEQLKATSPGEVCRILGVEAVFYGEVLDWAWLRMILLNSHSVEVAIRLYRRNAVLIWDGGATRAKEWRLPPARESNDPVITKEEQEGALEFLDFFTGKKLRSVKEVVQKVADTLHDDTLSRTTIF